MDNKRSRKEIKSQESLIVRKLTKEEFIEKAKLVHGNKYDYSKVNYINNSTKVCIICPEHGEFWQLPNSHLLSFGCSKCTNNYNYTTEEWIEKAKKVHRNKYDYSKVNYLNNYTKVCIICSLHSEFWQTPDNHLGGNNCPKCMNKSNLEVKVSTFLDDKVKVLKNYRGFKWLRYKKPLELDFYLPDYNIAIECQGRQHFYSKGTFFENNNQEYKNVKERDRIKKELCEKNNLPLYYINYNDDVEEKLNEILKLS